MDNFAIQTQGLRKEFGATVAVQDLTLTVNRGEVFGFLGPNGAGKTTSVKMLLGLTRPTTGTAVLLDQPLAHQQVRSRIGYLPEHFRFHPWLTAAEFLNLHGRLYGMSKTERTAVIPDLLALVDLADKADTKLKAFSKGMLQRIGLAQALLNNPELVFLDEPTSGLDPLGRRLVRDIITTLREMGTAVFLNSHLLSEVEKTCDRVAFIRDGRIIETISLADFDQDCVQLTIRVGEPSPALLDQLTQFGESVHLNRANGRIHLTIPQASQLPELAAWLVTHGHALYELTPEPLSLEDRFLQIIGSPGKPER
ncbi:MAG: ABC transporter ATP-binding protein [Chloroflexota bacterium]